MKIYKKQKEKKTPDNPYMHYSKWNHLQDNWESVSHKWRNQGKSNRMYINYLIFTALLAAEDDVEGQQTA